MKQPIWLTVTTDFFIFAFDMYYFNIFKTVRTYNKWYYSAITITQTITQIIINKAQVVEDDLFPANIRKLYNEVRVYRQTNFSDQFFKENQYKSDIIYEVVLVYFHEIFVRM